MGRHSIPYQDRFNSKYDIHEKTGCWIWNKGLDRQGYGTISIGVLSKGTKRKIKASQVSWMIHRGTISEDLWVLHKCDNPSCVNPDHLFLGTHKDNQADSVRKMRHRSIGERNPKAKLTTDEVIKIKTSDKETAILANEFNVSTYSIWRIKSERAWKHLWI